MNPNSNIIDNRILEIRTVIMSLADCGLWDFKIGKFVHSDGGNFFIPTHKGKELLPEFLFKKCISYAVSGIENRMFYCSTPNDDCHIRQSRQAIKRIVSLLLDAIQVYSCDSHFVHMSQLECWKECEKVALLVFSKATNRLNQVSLKMISRYFSNQEILQNFLIDKGSLMPFLAHCGIEEFSLN